MRREMWSGMRRVSRLGAGAVAAMMMAGCLDLIGYRDHVVGDPFGTGGGGGETGGAGTTSTSSGGSGGAVCEPGEVIACYSGPEGTAGKGICKAGERVCAIDGGGYGECSGEILPTKETCATTADDDCDGHDCAIWSKVFGGAGNDFAPQVAGDSKGNVFVLFRMAGTLQQVSPPLTNEGPADLVLMKLDPSGAVSWVRRIGNESASVEGSLAADFQGQPIIAGWFTGSINIGDQSFSSMGDNGDAFVAKFGSEGELMWAQKFGDASFETVNDVAADGLGNIYVAGSFDGALHVGNNVSLVSEGDGDGFLLKLNGLSGAPIWGRAIGAALYQDARFVRVDGVGNVTFAGAFQGTINLGGDDLVVPGTAGHHFVARLDPSGEHLWSKAIQSDVDLTSIVTDAEGNVVMGGGFLTSANLGGDTVSSAGGLDIWLARWNMAGEHEWTLRFGGAGDEQLGGLAASTDAVFLVAWGNGVVSFGGVNLVPTGEQDVFAAMLTASGEHKWSRGYGSVSSESCEEGAFGGDGTVLLGCAIQEPVDFGSGQVTLAGGDGKKDAVVVKLGR